MDQPGANQQPAHVGGPAQLVGGNGNHAAGAGDTPDPAIPRDLEELAPGQLPSPDPITQHTAYRELHRGLYGTLRINGTFVFSAFLAFTAAQFTQLQTAHPCLSSYSKTPVSLYKLLYLLKHVPRGQQTAPLIQDMTDVALNQILSDSLGEGLDAAADDHKIRVLRRWIAAALSSIEHQHVKARMMITIHSRFQEDTARVRDVKNEYTRLMTSLCNRSQVNNAAVTASAFLQQTINDCNTYVRTYDEVAVQNSPLVFSNFIVVEDFSFTGATHGLNTVISNKTFWYKCHHAPGLSALDIKSIKDLRDELDPVLQGIRSFVQTPLELAVEQARNIRPEVCELRVEIAKFLDSAPGARSLGRAKSLMASIKSSKTMIDSLKPAGIAATEDTVGISSVQIINYMSEIDNYITERESDNRKAEQQARIESQELSKSAPQLRLPELHGFSSYLSWKNSFQTLIPLHSNDLIKKQIVRNSLKNGEDVLRTKDLSFKATVEFLEMKYNSPLLIPHLIDTMCKLKKANDNRSSYANLTQFFSLYEQLKIHGAHVKVDLNIRERMASLLLHEVNLALFFKDIGKYEEELKQKEKDDDPTISDDASIISMALGEKYEEERREHWISEMRQCFAIVRRTVSAEAAQRASAPASGGDSGGSNSRRKSGNRGGNYSVRPAAGCPVCHENHVTKSGEVLASLSQCRQFVQKNIKSRLKTVENLNYCRRCLRSRTDPAHVTSSGRGCKISDERDAKCNLCDPPSRTHHTLLHDPEMQRGARPGNPAGRPAPGSRGGGRGGGGRGGRDRGPRGRSANYHTSATSAPGITDNTGGGGEHDSDDTHHENVGDGDDTQNIIQMPTTEASAVCFNTSSSRNRFSLAMTRIFITCCSEVCVIANNIQHSVVALLDIGSSMGYIDLSLAKRLRLPQSGEWTGAIATLHGTKSGKYPIFVVNLITKDNEMVTAKFLGSSRIGHKEKVPDKLFDKLCQEFSLPASSVQNPHGAVELLIGLDTAHLLADKEAEFKSDRYPELFVCSSQLNAKFLLCGAVGKNMLDDEDVETLSFFTDIICFAAMVVEAPRHVGALHAKYTKQHILPWCSGFLPRSLKRLSAMFMSIGTSFYGNNNDKTYCDKLPQLAAPPAPALRLDFDPEPGTWAEDDERLSADHYSRISRCFNAKPSPLTAPLEDSAPTPSLTCSDCSRMLAACKVCRYIGSEISLNELKQLEIIRNSIKVIPNPDGEGKRLLCDYPFSLDPEVAFSAKYSNHDIARKNTERLRERVIKLGLGDAFHQEMQKIVEQGHAREVPDFTLENYPVHQFNFINYVQKQSISQPIRPVSNSASRNKRGNDINTATLAGPNFLASGLACLLSFRLRGGGAWCCDLSRAYRSVYTSEMTNNLRMYYWFKDIKDPSTITVYQWVRLNFGDRPAALVLEVCMREYLAPEARTIEVRDAANQTRLVDDFLGSCHNKERFPAIEADIRHICDSYGFAVKHFYSTGMTGENGENLVTGVLGLQWDATADLLITQTKFHPGTKRRGYQTGPELKDCDIATLVITKTTLSRLCGQAFSYCGTNIAPIQAALRILFSRSCRSLEKNDWKTPLNSVDPELDSEARLVLESIKNVGSELLPAPRALIPPGHSLEKIIFSSDASEYIYSFIPYFISKKNEGTGRSSVPVVARLKIHQFSIPVGEMCGLWMAVRFLPELFSLLPNLTDEIGHGRFNIFFATDSTCTAAKLNPSLRQKDVRGRNQAFSIHRICTETVQTYKNISIHFVHQSSENTPADCATKISPAPIELANSDLYRHGPRTWREDSWPHPASIFLSFSHNQDVFFAPPVAEQALPVSSEAEAVAMPVHLIHPEAVLQHDKGEGSINPGFLDSPSYSKLITNCSSLFKVIMVIKLILQLCRKGTRCSTKDAFSTLMFSHQRLYEADRSKSLFPHKDDEGIYRVSSRLSLSDGDILDCHVAPAIVSHRDHRLAKLLIRHAHLSRVPMADNIHLGNVFTLARLRQGEFATHITRSVECVKNYISRCRTCLYIRGQARSPALGSPRAIRQLSKTNVLFHSVSIDEIGPFERNAFAKSKKKVKYYLLVIACILSGAISIQVMETKCRRSVLLALYNHSVQYSPPSEVWCDAGTAIAPQPKSQLYRSVFYDHKMTVNQVAASHQKLNYCEKRIQATKLLLKSCFHQRSSLHIPASLGYTDILAIVNSIALLLNSAPLPTTFSGGELITANHLLKPGLISRGDGDITSLPFRQLQQALHVVADRVEEAFQAFLKTLKMNLISATRSYLQVNGGKNPFKKDDICLFIKTNEFYLCRVLKVHDQFCSVLTTDTNKLHKKPIHCSLLILIFRKRSSTPSELDMDGRVACPPDDPPTCSPNVHSACPPASPVISLDLSTQVPSKKQNRKTTTSLQLKLRHSHNVNKQNIEPQTPVSAEHCKLRRSKRLTQQKLNNASSFYYFPKALNFPELESHDNEAPVSRTEIPDSSSPVCIMSQTYENDMSPVSSLTPSAHYIRLPMQL